MSVPASPAVPPVTVSNPLSPREGRPPAESHPAIVIETPSAGISPASLTRPGVWRRYGRRLAVAAALTAVASLGGGYAYAHRGLEDTDDAQLEGDLVNVSARIPGKVAELLVSDDQMVEAGQVIARLETDQLTQQVGAAQADRDAADATLRVARAQLAVTEKVVGASLTQAAGGVELSAGTLKGARASLDEARAAARAARSKMDLAALELSRSKNLLDRGAVHQEDVDVHQTEFDAAKADFERANASLSAREAAIASAQGDLRASGGRLDAAKSAPEQVESARSAVKLDEARLEQTEAALALAKLNLGYAEVRAPVRGQVTRRAVQVGHMVSPDVPLLSLVPLDNVWVVANFKEDQLARIRPGRTAEVTIDTYGSRVFRGHVDTLGATSGARLSLLPAENASGNFVKVVQRVPVRIVLDGPVDVPLRPGMSADATVNVRD